MTHWKVQILILLFFAALTGFAAWSVTQVVTNFSLEFFIEDDQRLRFYFDDLTANFESSGFSAGLYTDKSSNLTTEDNQQKYLNLLNILDGKAECSHCDRNYIASGSLSSWFTSFLLFVDNNGCNSVCSSPSNCKTGSVVK